MNPFLRECMLGCKAISTTLLIGALSFTSVTGQTNRNATGRHSSSQPTIQQTPAVNYDSLVYASARVNGEYDVAVTALYYMMAAEPQKSTAYLDSLTTIYFITQAYPKCIIAGNQVLSAQSNNLRIMEIVAISQKMLGNVKTSLELYEKLYAGTHALKHAYYIAEMQYLLQRYGECMAMTEKIIAVPESEKEKLMVAVTADLQQTVALKAAALNIQGMVYRQMNNREKAKGAFESALRLEADFALPKTNLEIMNKEKIKQ